MTRADKIRSMSVEELAEYLFKFENEISYCTEPYCSYGRDDGTCAANGQHHGGQMAACREACIRYLNAEVKKTEKI